MKQEEIKDYNRLCAELLCFKCSINDQYELPNMMIFPPKGNSYLCHSAKVCCVEDMQFHTDWNWIMEIIEAIERIEDFYIQIEEKACYIYDISKFDNKQTNAFIIIDKDLSSKKEAVVKAIHKFLIWYGTINK